MIYLVSFNTTSGEYGHKHVFMESWASGEDTQEVMQIIANVHNLDVNSVIITSVFKLPDQ